MSKPIKFQFDASQPHQLRAIESTVQLFEELRPYDAAAYRQKVKDARLDFDDVVANFPMHAELSEDWLLANLNIVRVANGLGEVMEVELDDGPMLEDVKMDAHSFPCFTVEMETGTGKTYVYLRTIQELRARYQLRKFIIVVPSVAIYEGVIKSVESTREHFKGLYSNEVPRVIEYEGSNPQPLRDFAISDETVVLLMTVDSFNRASNNVYKPTEKLPGEWLPYQYIQAVRPVLILDENQNYQSKRAREALRTLKPLFALNYSATPGKRTNLFYRLGPLEAFQQGLVKKIEVLGVEEQQQFNEQQLDFWFADSSTGYGLSVMMRAVCYENGEPAWKVFPVKKNQSFYDLTHNPNFRGIKISSIDRKTNVVVLSDGRELHVGEGAAAKSKRDVFGTQIEETIKRHFAKQRELNEQGENVKVLSLFFIDRVANYTAPDGLIRELFDAAYDKLKKDNNFFKGWKAEEVRAGYFAQKKATKTAPATYIDTAIDEAEKKKEDKEAEKQAYHLIMQAKEKLLSFDEKVSFIFAHSALKEGWDNPNVFQICTLNQTTSEAKKRQEIGRGLRLCVDQGGQRVTTDHVNVLTVVANESYEAFANKLQAEYDEAGQSKPPMAGNAAKKAAKRNNKLYTSKEFKAFWEKLTRRAEYEILVDPAGLVTACVNQLNKVQFPEPHIVVTSGRYTQVSVRITLQDVQVGSAKLDIAITDSDNVQRSFVNKWYRAGNDLMRMYKEPLLKGFKVVEVVGSGTEGYVVFGDKGTLQCGGVHEFTDRERSASAPARRAEAQEDHPVFNLIDRCAQETKLTRSTVLNIFKQMDAAQKAKVFRNPEGFSGLFIRTVRELLADHIADRLEYHIAQSRTEVDLEKLFPAEKKYPQKELVEGSKASLYDWVQVDSDVEERFVKNRLNEDPDERMMCYLKFPAGFKIMMPKIIDNYNPDWGIIRKQEKSDVTMELVRETKGTMELDKLQYKHEPRKIKCAQKYFQAVGIDYRAIDDKLLRWWEKG